VTFLMRDQIPRTPRRVRASETAPTTVSPEPA